MMTLEGLRFIFHSEKINRLNKGPSKAFVFRFVQDFIYKGNRVKLRDFLGLVRRGNKL